jgi:hypothetical protein
MDVKINNTLLLVKDPCIKFPYILIPLLSLIFKYKFNECFKEQPLNLGVSNNFTKKLLGSSMKPDTASA